MRVFRVSQVSLIVIATCGAIGLGTFAGDFLRGTDHSAASIPLELISQAIDEEGTDQAFPSQGDGSLLRSLNLSRRQKEQLFDIRGQYSSGIQSQRQNLRSELTTLRQLMVSDVSDSEVLAQFEQVQNIRTELNEMKFQGYLAIRKVLTLKQRRIFSEQLQARKQSRRQRIRLDQTR